MVGDFAMLPVFLAFYGGFQPGEPGLHSRAGLAGDREDNNIGVQPGDRFLEVLDVIIKVRLEVDFIEHYHIAIGEHGRVFIRFIVALGHTGNHDALVFSQDKSIRANQVADVLDEQQVGLFQRQTVQGVFDHVGVEVAAAGGINLNDGYAQFVDLIGIDTGGDISFDDGHLHFIFQAFYRAQDEAGLTGPWRRHDVYREYMVTVQSLLVGSGFFLVGTQDILAHLNHFYAHLLHLDTFHIAFPPRDYLDTRLMAGGAGPVAVLGGENISAFVAAHLGWLRFKGERGAAGDGVFTEEVEVKLHTIADHAR